MSTIKWTRKAILKALKAESEKLGIDHMPGRWHIQQKLPGVHQAIRRRFGGYEEFIKKNNLNPLNTDQIIVDKVIRNIFGLKNVEMRMILGKGSNKPFPVYYIHFGEKTITASLQITTSDEGEYFKIPLAQTKIEVDYFIFAQVFDWGKVKLSARPYSKKKSSAIYITSNAYNIYSILLNNCDAVPSARNCINCEHCSDGYCSKLNKWCYMLIYYQRENERVS